MRVVVIDLRGCEQTKFAQYPLEANLGELRKHSAEKLWKL
jgi:hypothetical protein